MKIPLHSIKVFIAGLVLVSISSWPAQAKPKTEKIAYLGVHVEKVDTTLREQLKLVRGAGLKILGVVADSPAEKAGLQAHDILVLQRIEKTDTEVKPGALPGGDTEELQIWPSKEQPEAI
jgi:S1-C subfamily serine protease